MSSASFIVYTNNLCLSGEHYPINESMSLCEKLTAYYNILHHKCINVTYLRPSMDLIPYSFAPLNLFLVPYTLDLLPYYLSFANGAGGVGIFELFVFQCFV